jgi:hypothetical protein
MCFTNSSRGSQSRNVSAGAIGIGTNRRPRAMGAPAVDHVPFCRRRHPGPHPPPRQFSRGSYPALPVFELPRQQCGDGKKQVLGIKIFQIFWRRCNRAPARRRAASAGHRSGRLARALDLTPGLSGVGSLPAIGAITAAFDSRYGGSNRPRLLAGIKAA